MSGVGEKNENLFLLVAGPLIWAAHLLLAYITAAIWCAKYAGVGGSLTGVRIAIAVYTVIALAAIGFVVWHSYRRHRFGGESPPHDEDTPEDRHRFLGFAGLLVAGLSAIAVLYAAIPALFIETCR